MINCLSWRCHGCRRKQAWRRTRQIRNHDWHEVFRRILYQNTVFYEMWFLIVDPLTSSLTVITVVGLLDVVTISNSTEFKSFSLIMWIDVAECSTTLSFTNFPKRRKILFYFSPLISKIFFDHSPTILIFPFSNLNFTYCRWRRWGWRRWWGMTLLFHRCPWSWWRSRGWTWQAWNHNRNEVLCVTNNANSVFDEMWFLTIDPFVGVPVFIAKLTER